MSDNHVPYCPGCGHGIALRLIGEVVDELNLIESIIGVAPVGCAIRSWRLFNFDMTQAPHGRSPAVATGLKRTLPNNMIFCYQGDGDSAAIGLGELMHAALRCEKITIIMNNNTVYGATGGQIAPTTLINQSTVSYPIGRDPNIIGYPINLAEIIANISKNAYVARMSLNNVKNIRAAKNAVYKAFQTQQQHLGFSFVELLSTCPTGWKMSPLNSLKRLEEQMIPAFPLGEFSVPEGLN